MEETETEESFHSLEALTDLIGLRNKIFSTKRQGRYSVIRERGSRVAQGLNPPFSLDQSSRQHTPKAEWEQGN